MKRSVILLLFVMGGLHAQSEYDQAKPEKMQPEGPEQLSSVEKRNQVWLQYFQEQAKRDFALALEFKDRRHYAAALRRFQDFRLLYPSHPQTPVAVGHIADIYDKMSQPDRALAELRKYLKALPGTPDAKVLPLLARQADLEYRLGQWQEAISTCELILKFFPASAEAELARRRLEEMRAQPAPGPDRNTGTENAAEGGQSSLDRLSENLDIEN